MGVCVEMIECDRALLADLACQGRGEAGERALVLLDHCGDCEVRQVYAHGSGGSGILVMNQSFMTKLINNSTARNAVAGTHLQGNDQGRGGDWPPQLILGGTSIGELGDGFRVAHSFCVNLVGCQTYQARGYGFHICEHANSACLSGCRAYQGLSGGVKVDDSHEINISSSIICWNLGPGIQLNDVTWGTVSANNVIDNGGRTKPQHGIRLSGNTKTIQVSANAIFNWPGHQPMDHGVYEDETCSNNQITGNNISFYQHNAVAVGGRHSVESANLVTKDAYVHPGGLDIFPKDALGNPIMTPLPEDEFTTGRVDAFLDRWVSPIKPRV